MRYFKNLYWLIIISLFLTLPVLSQNITVKSRVDTQKVLIGDWIRLNIRAEHTPDIKLFWPDIDNSIGKFEVVKRDSMPVSTQENNRIIEQLNAIISVYDSGYFPIPALKFEFTVNNDTTKREILTDPINIAVNSIAVDTTQDIKDIKESLEMPFPIWLILLYFGIGLFILIIAYIIWQKIKHKKALPIFDKREPDLSPHENAYKKLYLLEEKKLWQKGMIKEYYSEVTEIIRSYIHDRYNIDALEMTTEQILNMIIVSQQDKKIQDILKTFLNLADYVKFAKFQPVPDENELELKIAYTFVDATKEQPAIQEESKEQENITKNNSNDNK